jgi:hypothetical protein
VVGWHVLVLRGFTGGGVGGAAFGPPPRERGRGGQSERDAGQDLADEGPPGAVC